MKKNLRIVSVAAAALLAVAPVAATAMPVNAATEITLGGNNAPVASDIKVSANLQATTRPEKATTDLNTGVTTYNEWDGKVNGTISASFGGQTYTGNLGATSAASVYEVKKGVKNVDSLNDFKEIKPGQTGKYRLNPGKKYYVRVNNVSFNFGSANALKNDLSLSGNNGVLFVVPTTKTSASGIQAGAKVNVNNLTTTKETTLPSGAPAGAMADPANQTIKASKEATIVDGNQAEGTVIVRYVSPRGIVHYATVKASDLKNVTITTNVNSVTGANDKLNGISTDRNGVMTNPSTLDVLAPITPVDVTNSKSVSFYEIANGNEVPTGSLNLTANPTSHELNVNAVLAAAKAKYAAHQLENGASNGASVAVTTDVKDLTDQLTKAGIKVEMGNFEAPASFSFNLTAKSAQNAATATLPITVSVANAAQTPAAQETTRTVKIMHISTIYDKNGKATHEPALRAYHTVSVVSDPVSLKDEKGNDAGKFYKLAGKDQYIKVGNVDGTKRTLKHNSYVYKSTGKRRGKTVLKKGSSVTTYGKSFMIAGHQMYRIGENKYVKKANF